jgi:hypothetical protein
MAFIFSLARLSFCERCLFICNIYRLAHVTAFLVLSFTYQTMFCWPTRCGPRPESYPDFRYTNS